MKALNEGKEKILDCGVLILGKEQVGKTSLYRQMVGKEFKANLDSTRGIDDNDVETVDRRDVDVEDDAWREIKNPDAGEQFTKTLGAKISANLPSKSADKENDDEIVEEGALLAKIRRTVRDIENLKKPPPEPKPRAVARLVAYPGIPTPPQPNLPPPPKRQHVEDTNATALIQQPLPPPLPQPKEMRERRPTQPTPLPQPPTRQPPVVPKDPTPPPPSPPPEEEPDATPPQPQEEGRVESGSLDPGILTQRQIAQLGEILRRKGNDALPAPRLHLNILDFAGQRLYHPMHHCYIARRALYLAVFKCNEMVPCTKDPKAKPHKPIEDIRYWIQSINAHIYPPDESEKRGDQTYNRVILVGTHRGDVSHDDLKKIDDLIEGELRRPNGKTVNHIRAVRDRGYCLNNFLAVENSIDKKTGSNYREKSGIKVLQENIQATARKLGFMQEEHPIKWLKFQDRLERSKAGVSPVMTMAEAKQLAVQSRITDEDQQELALKFFHDTKKIICLSKFVIISNGHKVFLAMPAYNRGLMACGFQVSVYPRYNSKC